MILEIGTGQDSSQSNHLIICLFIRSFVPPIVVLLITDSKREEEEEEEEEGEEEEEEETVCYIYIYIYINQERFENTENVKVSFRERNI